MSTIYTDGAGNKYLGDCRWGNHDINYPTTNYLLSVDSRVFHSTFLSDISSLFTSATWGNISVASPTIPTSGTLFSATIPGESAANYFRLNASSDDIHNSATIAGLLTSASQGNTEAGLRRSGFNFDYSVCIGDSSIAFLPFAYNATKNNLLSTFYTEFNYNYFYYWGKLKDVNTNFGYYNASFVNQCVLFSRNGRNPGLTLVDSNGTTEASHYIANAKKSLLRTGRAAYTISCSDGQTPGAQWATDMWVYDNNATLGYPVIGRVPNMLLGIGTYTYLKPVKIQGSVFPDNGSPWYLPVGTYAGKTLLMRCYSSMA